MTPPTEEEELASLASLSGTQAPGLPVDALSRAVLRVGMIATAKGNGLTWAQIGSVLGGVDGKTAKARAKRLARQVNKALASAGIPAGEAQDGI
jgi:hypothetical protein